MAPADLMDKLHNWVHDTFGVDPNTYPSQSTGNAAAPAPPGSNSSPAAPGGTAGRPSLTLPQFGKTAPATLGVRPAPQLLFQLTPDELKACNQYLDAHFDAVPTKGAPSISPDSYKPALEETPVAITDVVGALMPLTLAGSMSKDGSDQIYKDTWSQLYDLAQARLTKIALSKSKAATDTGMQQAAAKVVAEADEAETWIKNYLRGNDLGPDILGDGTGSTVMFANKTTPIATVIDTTVAAGRMANLQSGDNGRALITSERVARIVTQMLVAARPKVAGGDPAKKADGSVPSVSMQLGYTFTPQTTHTTASGAESTDQPAHQLSGTLNIAFHADDASGWEVSATGQVTWFADDKGGHIQTQSGLTGVQVAWVWSFLGGALQAGPLFQALVGASRAQQTISKKLEWAPTGQVGLGGQVQYAIPGFGGHVLVGMQAGSSATTAKGADGTIDQTAALTFTYKF